MNLTRYRYSKNSLILLIHLEPTKKEECCPDFERSEQAIVLRDLDCPVEPGFPVDPVCLLQRGRF
ncbi:MAG: hypothetical protein ACW987_17345, partial [Candidatus Thorarchaeota archaeon]